MAVYFFNGLSMRLFDGIVISVVKFFVACLVSEALNDKWLSRPPSCFINTSRIDCIKVTVN